MISRAGRGRARHAKPRPPHRAALGPLALLGLTSAVGGVLAAGAGPHHPGGPAAAGHTARPAVPAPEATGDAVVRPSLLTIPAIRVRSALETLTLSAARTLQVPTRPARAGWFSGGSVPGQVGPAVLVGHLDSVNGPAVFARLSFLRPDDVVTVTLTDGRVVRFLVTSIRRYPKNAFPTAAVYGPQPDPELRLITCGGTFDGHQYLDNIVVFARLAPPGSHV